MAGGSGLADCRLSAGLTAAVIYPPATPAAAICLQSVKKLADNTDDTVAVGIENRCCPPPNHRLPSCDVTWRANQRPGSQP